MNKEELIDLVKKIQSANGTEEELDKMQNILEENVIDPSVSNYIFYEDLFAEEVVEKALNYESIKLPESFE